MGCTFKPLHAIMATGTVIILLFDVATNWYAFSKFLSAKTADGTDKSLTIALGFASTFGTLLWALAVRNMVYACKACGAEDAIEAQESVARWEESTSFFQLVLQDGAVVIVVYMTFRYASCDMYLELFVYSLAATAALIGALSGSVWKIVRGFIDCICCCFTKGETGCGWACFCCICRLISSLISGGILGFVAYQFLTYRGMGYETRSDCTTTG